MVDLTKHTSWREMRRCEHGIRVGQRCHACATPAVELNIYPHAWRERADHPRPSTPLVVWGAWGR